VSQGAVRFSWGGCDTSVTGNCAVILRWELHQCHRELCGYLELEVTPVSQGAVRVS